MKNIELLSKICSVAGAPGHEKKIRNFIIGEVKKEGLAYTVDNLGNLIVKIKGKKRKECYGGSPYGRDRLYCKAY